MWRTLRATFIFYTCLPLSSCQPLDFRGIAAYAPLVGVVIGGILGLWDWGLGWVVGTQIHFLLLRATLVSFAGLWLTGGLHLDGAMDTADGLAVIPNTLERRLEVMADSVTGAYGVMAAIAILLLKISALTAIQHYRIWILMAVAAWARWGQLRAIAAYPYLKASGKGKFHQEHIYQWQVWLAWGLLTGSSFAIGFICHQFIFAVIVTLTNFGIAWCMGAWLNHKLGGHTGDTYGAIVEWTEALGMVAIAMLI